MATIASLAVEMTANSGKLVKEIQRTNKRLDSFGKKAKSTANAVTAAFSAIALGSTVDSILDVSASFQTLQTSLTSAFGSQERAAIQFQRINEFASRTPFTISEITEASIKMKNLGLDPSIASLEAMGNTASSMGKPLMQFVEAVADAATGEMERLKEFGIRSSKEGENFRFTFKGVETTIANSSNAIQDYLLNLGRTEFAGSIEAQSETLNGVFSTLAGAAENLTAKFSEKSGLSGAAKETAKWLTSLFNRIATGSPSVAELQARLDQLESQTIIGGRNKSLEKTADKIDKIKFKILELNAAAGDVGAINSYVDALEERIVMQKQLLPDNAGEKRKTSRRSVVIGGAQLEEIARLEEESKAYQDLAKEIMAMDAEATKQKQGNAQKEIELVRIQEEAYRDLLEQIKAVDEVGRSLSNKSGEIPKAEGSKIEFKDVGTAEIPESILGRSTDVSMLPPIQQPIADVEAPELPVIQPPMLADVDTPEPPVISMNQGFEVASSILGPDPEGKLAQVQEFLMTEEEKLQESLANRLLIVESAKALELEQAEGVKDAELAIEDKFIKIKEKLYNKHLKQMDKVRKSQDKGDQKSFQNRLSGFIKFTGQYAGALKGFEKANAIASATQAFVATLTGQAEALKGPWPLNLLAAAQVGVAGFGFVSAIKSATGGGGPSGSSSVPSASISGVDSLGGDSGFPDDDEETRKEVTINVEGVDDGAFLSKGQVREIIEQINEEELANVRINI